MTISRTWNRRNSDGTFFRNCSAVDADLRRLENKLPWRYKALTTEWYEIFHVGVTIRETIPDGDRWVAYDDSPEATAAWVKNFMAAYGHSSPDLWKEPGQ